MLSQKLANILEGQPSSGTLTLNELLTRTEGRGLFMVIIVLCLPFIAPVSVPGMSTPFGTAIIILVSRLLLGKKAQLPKRIGDRALPPGIKRVLSRGGLKFLRFVEKAVRPRETQWMSRLTARHFNAYLLTFMAFLLALPLPPIPPFTNAFPSYTIILLSASMMEEDGVLIWAGYGASIITIIYFSVCAEIIAHHFSGWVNGLIHWYQSLWL
jgi:hypothetical protein